MDWSFVRVGVQAELACFEGCPLPCGRGSENTAHCGAAFIRPISARDMDEEAESASTKGYLSSNALSGGRDLFREATFVLSYTESPV